MENKDFQIYNQNNAVVEEAYSFLRANFNFSNIDNKYKTLALISSNPKEGKTSIAINLAINFANGGTKTLLVDTDFRKPVSVKRLSGDKNKGLSNYLTDELLLNDIIMVSNIDNLDYIPCGSKIMNPSALLSSNVFEEFLNDIKDEYELIILDTPAVTSVSDGYIVASKADATLLAIKAGEVTIPNLKRVKEQLEKAKANVIGVVLNRVTQSEYRKSYEAYDYFNDENKFKKGVRRNRK